MFAIREEVATKDDIDGLKEDFSKLESSVDNHAKKVDTYSTEMTVLSHKIDRHEKWIEKAAKKLGIKLEYI